VDPKAAAMAGAGTGQCGKGHGNRKGGKGSSGRHRRVQAEGRRGEDHGCWLGRDGVVRTTLSGRAGTAATTAT
jgi:hypothetical protein